MIGYGKNTPDVIILRMSHMFMINYNYLVIDQLSRNAVIIDPAWQMDKIEQAIVSNDVILKGILLTHSHHDHTSLAKPLSEKYDCPVWMSKEEIAISGYNAKHLIGIGSETLNMGQMIIHPILTPGHTPGSTSYYIGENLFTGDTLFAEGCGLCTDVKSAHEMYSSLERLKFMIPPETRIYPGHMYGTPPGQTFSHLLENNIYLNFKNKNDFASYRLRENQNVVNYFNFL